MDRFAQAGYAAAPCLRLARRWIIRMTLLIVLVLLTALSVETSRRLGLLSPAAFGLAFVVLNLALLAIPCKEHGRS